MTEELFECVYCGKQQTSPNSTGSDVECCGEVGHSIPIEQDQDA